MTPDYSWQEQCVEVVTDILYGQGKDHVYIEAPTGTGKTRAISKCGNNRVTSGYHILMVGMTEIVKQHTASFKTLGHITNDEADERVILTHQPTGNKWIIATWQGLKANPTKYTNGNSVCELYFDECHFGGSNKNNISYKEIIKTLSPLKKINVSATTFMASEKLLGQSEDHIYRLKKSEADAAGILHPVDLVEVQSGVSQEVLKMEKDLGINSDDFEKLTTVTGSLEDISKKYTAMSVSIKDKLDDIKKQRYLTMIGLYLEMDTNEQAIFFLPDIKSAEEACAWFNNHTLNTGGKKAHCINSQNKNSSIQITEFRDKKIDVLFAVNMLQEGFDLLSLSLIFDCTFYRSWNKRRRGRIIQKIGRLTRIEAGKPTSKYYFARDISDYYSETRTYNPTTPEFNEEEKFVKEAEHAAATIAATSEGEDTDGKGDLWNDDDPITITVGETEVDSVIIDDFDTSDLDTKRTINTATTPYVLSKVHDKHKTTRTIPVTQLYNKSAYDLKVVALIREAKRQNAENVEDKKVPQVGYY